MTIEEMFAKVVGHQASESEREHLHRLREALGLRDNDAFWYIVMTLEHYDSLYREYPERMAAQAIKAIEGTRKAFAEAAAMESAKAQHLLARQVARTSVQIAKKMAGRDGTVGLRHLMVLVAGLVLFGALCMDVGYTVATSGARFAWGRAGQPRGREQALSVVLDAPAGWMAFTFLLPLAVSTGRWAWMLAIDGGAARTDRVTGAVLVLLCAGGTMACLVVLCRVM
jgi:hypothetical protein